MRNALQNDAGEALARLQSVVHTLTALPIEPDAPEILLAQALAALGADGGVLGIVNDGLFIDALTYRGYSEERVREYGRLSVGPRFPLTDAVWRQQPVWLCGAAERVSRYPELTGPQWSPTIACLPLVLGSRCVGVLGLSIDHERACFTPTERSVLLTLADICAFVLHRWQLGIAASAGEPEPASSAADHLALVVHHLSDAHTTEQLVSLIATMLPPAVGADSAFLAVAGSPSVIPPDQPANRVVLGAYAQHPRPGAVTGSETAHVTGLEQSLLTPGQTVPAELMAERRSWAAYPVVSRGVERGVLGVVWHRPREITPLLHDQLTAVTAVCASTLDSIPARSS